MDCILQSRAVNTTAIQQLISALNALRVEYFPTIYAYNSLRIVKRLTEIGSALNVRKDLGVFEENAILKKLATAQKELYPI